MAVTNTLQRVLGVAQTYIRNAPLVFPALSAPNDLALLAGDWVRQFVLSPPFAWRWNRGVASFATVAGTQDYAQSLPSFGWLEKAALQNTSGTTAELEVKLNLADDTVQNQPLAISPRLDNNSGQITFRLLPVPEQIYTITLTYQQAAPTFTSLLDLWTPLPDYLCYLYMQGFLAKSYEYFADERFGSAMQLFIKQLVAANTGLDQTQMNIFLGERIDTARQQTSASQNVQLGNQGRYMG